MTAIPLSQRLDECLVSLLDRLAVLARSRRRWRIPLLLVAGGLFFAGAYWAFSTLPISPTQLRVTPLLILAGLILPSLVYGGIGLWLLARSAGLSMPVGRATVISAYAYLAEMLPLPGGAVVRAAALIQAGSAPRRSSALVIFTAILWISLAMFAAGLTLLPVSARFAMPLLSIGGLVGGAIFLWLWSIAGAAIALQTLAHRIAGILLTALRLTFAFAALHMPIGVLQAFPFVLAILLGSASSVAPAGLGISESLAALAATASDYPAGIAFLAVGIDRLFCIGGCAVLALGTEIGTSLRSAGTGGVVAQERDGNER